MRHTTLIAAALCLPMLLPAQAGGDQRSPAQILCEELTSQLNKLNRDYRAARKVVTDSEEYKQALEARDREKLNALMAKVAAPDLATLGRKAVEHAYEFQDDERLLLLTWAANNSRDEEIVKKVVADVRKDHMKSPALVPLLENAMSLSRAIGQEEGAKFLAEVATATPHDVVRAWSMYWQAVAMQRDRNASDETKAKAEAMLASAEQLAKGTDLADMIAGPRFIEERLQIGMVAPEIVGEDVDGVPFQLSDYRGKVVVLDFWGFW